MYYYWCCIYPQHTYRVLSTKKGLISTSSHHHVVCEVITRFMISSYLAYKLVCFSLKFTSSSCIPWYGFDLDIRGGKIKPGILRTTVVIMDLQLNELCMTMIVGQPDSAERWRMTTATIPGDWETPSCRAVSYTITLNLLLYITCATQ